MKKLGISGQILPQCGHHRTISSLQKTSRSQQHPVNAKKQKFQDQSCALQSTLQNHFTQKIVLLDHLSLQQLHKFNCCFQEEMQSERDKAVLQLMCSIFHCNAVVIFCAISVEDNIGIKFMASAMRMCQLQLTSLLVIPFCCQDKKQMLKKSHDCV